VIRPTRLYDRRVIRTAFLAVVLVSLGASSAAHSSAVDTEAPATTLRKADLRVATVAYRLGLEAASLCADHYPLTGLLLHHLPEYDAAGRAIEIERYGLDRGPGVLLTVAGSPAARSGLLAGDVLLAVDGAPFADPRAMVREKDRKVWRRQVEASETQLETALAQGPARLRVLRGGREIDVTLASVPGCPIRVRLARSDQFNAFSDGRYVTFTTAMLDFLRSDDELAILLGHELAHNLLGHKERLEQEHVPQGLLRGVGANADKVWQTEAEADRLGLRLAWAAGYDIRAAADLWHRYYAAHDVPLQIFRTHPSLHARQAILEATVAELERTPRPPAGP